MTVETHSPQSDCIAPVRPSIPAGPTVASAPIQAFGVPAGTTVESAFGDLPGRAAGITAEAAFIKSPKPADRSLATIGSAPIEAPEPAGGALATTHPASLNEHRAAVLRHRDEAEQLGDNIAELAARIQAATYELLVMIRAFDEREGWSGFKSCAHWLNRRTGLALGAAREKVRVARALSDLPLLSGAMQRGRISYSKVRALTRVATRANERRLLGFAECAPAWYVERLARAWRRVDMAEEAADERRRHERRQLTTWVDDDGMLVIRGRLSPGGRLCARRSRRRVIGCGRRRRRKKRQRPATGNGRRMHWVWWPRAPWRRTSTGERRGIGTRWCCTSRPRHYGLEPAGADRMLALRRRRPVRRMLVRWGRR